MVATPHQSIKATCPWCDTEMTMLVNADKSQRPFDKGSAGICASCIQPIVFAAGDHGQLTLRKPTREEQQTLNKDATHQSVIRQLVNPNFVERVRSKTLKEEWESYRREVLVDLPRGNIENERDTWYAGALSVFNLLMTAAIESNGAELQPTFERVMEELTQYMKSVSERIIADGKKEG